MKTDLPSSIMIDDVLETRFGTLKFFDGYPDEDSIKKLYDNLDFSRGVQAYLASISGTYEYEWVDENYDIGTLVVDFVDRSAAALVFRGTINGVVSQEGEDAQDRIVFD